MWTEVATTSVATRVSRPTPKSLQQVLDPSFELFGIVGPVAIDFQAVGSDSPAVRGAPLTQCLVRGSKFLIGPPMNDYCRFARWRPAARSQEGPATGHESRLSPCRVEHAAELPIGPRDLPAAIMIGLRARIYILSP